MQKVTGRQLIALLVRQSAELNEILKTVQEEETQDEFVRIRLMVGKIMGSIYSDALYPIMEEYPALKPDYLK